MKIGAALALAAGYGVLAGVGLLGQYNLARALGDRPAPPRARKRGDELPTPAGKPASNSAANP